MNEEMKNKNSGELHNDVQSLKKEYFDLKLGLMTGQITDVSQLRKIRVKIAQALTLLNMKKNSSHK